MPKRKSYSNFREKFVDGIKEVIRNGHVNIKDMPALCSVTYPYVKRETTMEIIESLLKLKMLSLDEVGILTLKE